MQTSGQKVFNFTSFSFSIHHRRKCSSSITRRKYPFSFILFVMTFLLGQDPHVAGFLLPCTHNAPFQPQHQERVQHGRLHNFRKPSIFALPCGLADRQQEGKSAATVFIQPGASCCVVGCFVLLFFLFTIFCLQCIAPL